MDRWAEGLLLTLVDIAPALRAPEPDYDVLADYMLAATLGLNEMICMGVSQDWATHAIGHEITALTGMAHGATLAIVYPALLRVLIDAKEAKLVQMGERVFDVHFGTARERALETIARLEAFFASLGPADPPRRSRRRRRGRPRDRAPLRSARLEARRTPQRHARPDRRDPRLRPAPPRA